MIYNLVQYLRNELPSETIYFNVKDLNSLTGLVPDRLIIVQDTGGEETPWFQFQTQNYQIITRDIDSPKARKLIDDVCGKIVNKFGLILPSKIIDGVLYDSVQTAQISYNTLPQSLGVDNGLFIWTSNLYIKE